ncbi:MAG: hypothetical protein ACEQR5_04945 [Moraxellaceae bacterium]
MKTIYLFSGLGADKRVFDLLQFPEYQSVFIKWISPNKKESIENYTARILNQITTKKPILIGLSFGGIIAVEVAKQIETEKVILLASAKSKREIPVYYRLAGSLQIHHFVPVNILKQSNFLTNWLFGANSKHEKQILKLILSETDPVFLKWAIDILLKWKNEVNLLNLIHLHGNKDRILPIRLIKNPLIIKDGGHLMILNKAEQLNQLLIQLLENEK